jgi:ketosteroid isomerase-like protein
MSKENLEVVRASVEAFADGDLERLESYYTPDAKISRVPDGWPESGPFEDRDAVMLQFVRIQEDWQEHSMTIAREATERDWVVAELRWKTRGASSGVPLEVKITGAYRLEDKHIAEARFHWQFDDALEDAGISGQGARTEH